MAYIEDQRFIEHGVSPFFTAMLSSTSVPGSNKILGKNGCGWMSFVYYLAISYSRLGFLLM